MPPLGNPVAAANSASDVTYSSEKGKSYMFISIDEVENGFIVNVNHSKRARSERHVAKRDVAEVLELIKHIINS